MLRLIEALPTAVVLIDAQGRIEAWNAAATALYGWASYEVVDGPFDQLVEEADIDEMRGVLAEAQDRGRWAGNFRIRRRDGVLLVSSFLAVRVQGPAGQPVVAWIGTDARDQSLAEEERAVLLSAERAARDELEATLGLLEALFDSAPLGMAIFDLDLRCTHTNSMFVRMIGAETDPTDEFLDDLPTLPPQVTADLRRVATTGQVMLDRRVVLAGEQGEVEVNASYFPVFTHGHPAGAGLAWTDTTAARRAEGERLRQTRRADAAQRRLAVLASASSVLTTSNDVGVLLERLVRVLAPGAVTLCVIELFGKDGVVEHAAVAHADRSMAQAMRRTLLGKPVVPSPESPLARVVGWGQALLLDGAQADAVLPGCVSAIVVPIRTRSETLGVLRLADDTQPLTDDDLDMAVEVAHRTALAAGRAITYRNEHLLAEELQQALLPTRLPDIASVPLQARYAAAAHTATIGGDWYDAFELPSGKLLVSVGDVVGHDTTAAVGMSRVRYLLGAFATEEARTAADGWPDLDRTLDRAERLLADDPTAWATCLVAVLDVGTGELRIANAGHPPPLIVRDGVPSAVELAGGTFLGIGGKAGHPVETIKLCERDRVLLYTDGLIERRGEALTVGEGRLLEAARRFQATDLARFCDELMSGMFEGTAPADDVAILAFDYLSTAG